MSQLALSRRVNIAIQVADSLARRRGLDPVRHAAHFARAWRNASAEDRRKFMVVHCAMKPDEIVFRQFVEALEGRAERVRS